MSDLLAKLNKGLKFGSGGASNSLYHDNEAAILDAATKLLATSPVGMELLDFARENGVKMHVLKTTQDAGFMPAESTVYINCPASQPMPGVRAVIHLAGALREAMLEHTDGLKRPSPAIGRDRFVRTQIERGTEVLGWQAMVVHEIHEATGLREIIDEFESMGYASLLEAHRLDLQEKTSKS